jgi:hypothetical protein
VVAQRLGDRTIFILLEANGDFGIHPWLDGFAFPKASPVLLHDGHVLSLQLVSRHSWRVIHASNPDLVFYVDDRLDPLSKQGAKEWTKFKYNSKISSSKKIRNLPF